MSSSFSREFPEFCGFYDLITAPVVVELGPVTHSVTQVTEEDRFDPSSKSCCLKRGPFVPFF